MVSLLLCISKIIAEARKRERALMAGARKSLQKPIKSKCTDSPGQEVIAEAGKEASVLTAEGRKSLQKPVKRQVY